MKRILVSLSLLLTLSIFTVSAQKHDFANWKRYAAANKELGTLKKGERRVVLMGNSITDGWASRRKEFFNNNNLIGRGISGQTSYQFLLRFREDVLNLQPSVVVINYGTNDIAENTGAYDEDLTYGNVLSMVELAQYHNAKVILTSCLPAAGFGWRPSITDAMDKIRLLNARVKAYAEVNGIPYVDYFSALVAEDGSGMKPELGNDTPAVHPNNLGYEIMESMLLPVIEKQRKRARRR